MWKTIIKKETNKDYFKELIKCLEVEYQTKSVYPAYEDIFKCFELTPFEAVKVVIVGQDPYHQPHQAQGLSFSVPKGVTIPPSLRNILQELEDDLGVRVGDNGSLVGWAQQGVLLLNRVLTVRESEPNSHKKLGWEHFTNAMITALNDKETPVVFILWGKNAQELKKYINAGHHYIIEGPHPSPLSSYRGFFGSKPFSQTNQFLAQTGQEPIVWEDINHV